MARQSDAQILRELQQFYYWKWQFLRRNENYIRDCEQWRGVPRDKWDKREIILGRPDLKSSLFKPSRKIRLAPYGLIFNKPWKPYAEKWLINYPLNPFISNCPFFVNVAPHTIISEVENGTYDVFLDRGTSSSIQVNWSAPLSYLEYQFRNIARIKQRLIERQGKKLKDLRTQLRMYSTYLKVWDLRQQKLTYQQIAEKVYPRQIKSDASIKKNYEAARKLIDGGYKDIG